MIPEDRNNSRVFAISEDVSRLKSEVDSLRRELRELKRAILHTPDIGDKVQKNSGNDDYPKLATQFWQRPEEKTQTTGDACST